MAENVIRQDVVQIEFDIADNPFSDLTREMHELQRQAVSGVGGADNEFRELHSSAVAAASGVDDISESIMDMNADNVSNISDEIEDISLESDECVRAIRETERELSNMSEAGIDDVADSLESSSNAADELNNNLRGNGPETLRNGLEKSEGVLKKLISQAGKLTVSLGKDIAKGVGKAAKLTAVGIAGAGAGIGGMLGASIKTGSDYEAGMSQVAATMGIDNQSEDYKLLSDTAKEMGKSTKFSATESAEALNYLALAGYDAEKACNALPTILNLAAAGGMDLAYTSDMVTDSMSALGIEATQENLVQFGDQLAKTSQKSNTSVQQLGEAILTVGGTAKSLKGGTTELNALLGILADNGVKGAEGGTALRNVMLSLQAPTDVAMKSMQKLGLEVYDSQGNMRPMNEVLKDLNASMEGMTSAEKDNILSTIFNKADLKSINALLANSGERYDELSGYIENSDDAMQNMAETMSDNLKGRITEFKSAMEGLQISIFEAARSSRLKDFVQEATGWISELSSAADEGGFEGFANALGSVFAKAITRISSFLPSAVKAGSGIIKNLITGVKQNLPSIVRSITGIGVELVNGISDILPLLLLVGCDIIIALGNGINDNLPQILIKAGDAVRTLLEGIIEKAPEIIQTGMDILMTLSEGISQQLPTLIPLAITAILVIVSGLIQNLPQLISAGLQILAALALGISNSIPELVPMAVEMVTGLTNGLIQNLPMLIQAALQIILALNIGLIQAIPELITATPKMIKALVEALFAADWKSVGGQIVHGIGEGLKNGLSGLMGKGKEGGTETANGFTLGVESGIPSVMSSVGNLSGTAVNAMELDKTQITALGTDGVKALADSISASQTLTDEASASVAEGVVQNVDNIDLTSSGENAMKGFNNGLLSQKASILATATNIANEVKKTTNNALDIHSPSREMMKTGRFTGQGLVLGIESSIPNVRKSAERLGETTKYTAANSSYTPENSTSYTKNSSNENNTYAPVFNIYVNGDADEKNIDRKIKSAFKESLKEVFNSMDRKNPSLQEV